MRFGQKCALLVFQIVEAFALGGWRRCPARKQQFFETFDNLCGIVPQIVYARQLFQSEKDPNVKLLLCEHPEVATEALKLLAAKELETNVRWFTLAPQDIHRALYISDVFVLPSFTEGLPNALIEAVMAEPPVICHPHPGGKYILEDDQWLVDLSTKGTLGNRLKILRGDPRPEEEIKRLQNRAIERFSAANLAGEFYEMVRRVHTTDTKNLERSIFPGYL